MTNFEKAKIQAVAAVYSCRDRSHCSHNIYIFPIFWTTYDQPKPMMTCVTVMWKRRREMAEKKKKTGG